jgi:uncharacterized membrane protein
MFSVPSDFISELLNYTKDFFNDVKPFFFLAIGVATGLLLISFVVEFALKKYMPQLPDIDDDDDLEDFEL